MAGSEVTPAASRPPSRTAAPVRIRRALWAVTVLHIGLLLAYSVLVPALRGPDEHLHVDRIRRLAPGTPESPPGDGASSVSAGVAAARTWSPAYQVGSPPVAARQAVPAEERPTFAELGAQSPTAEANALDGQPPLAHVLGAVALGGASLAPGWPWPFDRVVALLRLIGIVATATLPLLAWATARRLGCPPRAALTSAIVVLAIPQLTHVGSTVSSDALLIALAGTAFWLGARVLTGDASARTAALSGLCAGAALLTAGLGVVFLIWFGAVYLLASGASDRQLTARQLVSVGAVASVVGGWWWVRDLVEHGHLPFGLGVSPVTPAGGETTVGLTRAVSTLARSYWGDVGWLEASLPTTAVVLATVVVVGAVGVAFWRGRVPAVRRRLALFVLPTVALAVVVAVGAVVVSLTGSAAFVFQGRYLLPGVVGLAVVVAVGLDQLARRPIPALPLLVLVAALAMQGLGVMVVVRRYWAGPSVSERLRAVLAFSPWPPVVVFFGGVGVLLAAGWALVEVARSVRDSIPTTAPRPAEF